MKSEILNKIKEVLTAHDNIAFAYVFGSFVKAQKKISESNKKSFNDIDVAVYLSYPLITGNNKSVLRDSEKDVLHNSLLLELRIENELEEILHTPVDVRIINSSPLAFQYNVIKDGKVLIDNDKNLRADFEGLVFKKYFDYVYIRNEYLKNIVNAPI